MPLPQPTNWHGWQDSRERRKHGGNKVTFRSCRRPFGSGRTAAKRCRGGNAHGNRLRTGGRCQKSGGSAADLCGKRQTGRQSADRAHCRNAGTGAGGSNSATAGGKTGRTVLAGPSDHDSPEAERDTGDHFRRAGYGGHSYALSPGGTGIDPAVRCTDRSSFRQYFRLSQPDNGTACHAGYAGKNCRSCGRRSMFRGR